MKTRPLTRNLLPVALLALALPAHAAPQVWLDAYAGRVVDDSAHLTLYQDLLFGPDSLESTDFDPGLRGTGGLRVRVETDSLPVGFALDVGAAHTHAPQADLTLVPMAMGVTLPMHLVDGPWHPMGMLGLVVTGVDGDAHVGSIQSEVNDTTWGGSNRRVGLHASAGLAWQPAPRLAFFAEYRYQQMRFHLEHTNNMVLATQYLETNGRVDAEAVLVGVSFGLLTGPAPVSTP